MDAPSVKKVVAPRGTHPCSYDDKGRVKLPVDFQDYLKDLGSDVFVTTVDKRSVRIYPLPVWQENEALLSMPTENPKQRNALLKVLQAYGRDTRMDESGRVPMPPEVRKLVGMERTTVYVTYMLGRIDVITEAQHLAELAEAETLLPEALEEFEKRGFK